MYAPPVITGVVNHRNGESSFDTRADEYMSVFFKSDQPDLTRADVMPEMDGFGVYPASVARSGGSGWQMDCQIDAATGPASRTIRLRTGGSTFGAPASFVVDAPFENSIAAEFSGPLEIQGMADGLTWEDNIVHLDRDACLSIWVRGLPDEVTRSRLHVRIANFDAQVLFVSAPDEQKLRQINVRFPAEILSGEHPVAVAFGTSVAAARPVRVVPKN